MTEREIKDKYKKLHDELSVSYYFGASGLTKEQFDLKHGKIWSDVDAELISGGYRKIPEPPRNLVVEIDALKARIEMLEKR